MNTNHSLPSSAQALKDRYSYMFASQNIGFAFYRGWFELLAQLCADIDAALGENQRDFHWVQIKEKFGAYRLYYSLNDKTALTLDLVAGAGHVRLRPKAEPASADAPASPAQLIRQLVSQAEDATTRMCMACGRPAEARSYGGYYLTLCVEHAPDMNVPRSDPQFAQTWKKVWQASAMPDDQEGSS